MTAKRDIRQLVRPLIPLPVWRAASRGLDLAALLASNVNGKLGLLKRNERDAMLTASSLNSPLHYRQCRAHSGAILQNCIRREYDRHIPTRWAPKTILDGGGYIGDLAVHWASKWPTCEICSVEPSDANFAYAERNITPYSPRVRLLKGAIWNRAEFLSLEGSETGTRVSGKSLPSSDIRGYTIPEVMTYMGWTEIDILKLDIEGAEYSVLDSSCDAWLPSVNFLIIEFHDPARNHDVERRLTSAGFSGRTFRSLVTFARNWNQPNKT